MEKKFSILIIEDEKDIAELIKDYFEESNYQVLMAHSRNEAFFKINNQTFDLILSDIKLNTNDVVPILKELQINEKSLNHGVPIVIHSAHVTGPIIRKHKSIIKAVMVKPTNSEELVEKVTQIINLDKLKVKVQSKEKIKAIA